MNICNRTFEKCVQTTCFIDALEYLISFASTLFTLYLFTILNSKQGRSLLLGGRLSTRSISQDSVYTILIRLPPDGGNGDERTPSIKMIQDDVPLSVSLPLKRPHLYKNAGKFTY